jgi:hypothetical protein
VIAVEAVGATGFYLPAYSPDLNPIALVFSKIKALLLKAAERTVPRLWRQIRSLLASIGEQECIDFSAMVFNFAQTSFATLSNLPHPSRLQWHEFRLRRGETKMPCVVEIIRKQVSQDHIQHPCQPIALRTRRGQPIQPSSGLLRDLTSVVRRTKLSRADFGSLHHRSVPTLLREPETC